ncbi:MAG TPA: OmpH family outer membrane protein [Bacteroidales bacterium]|nr:OmpH family outer membrane protein [Bacteroidales bacterium]
MRTTIRIVILALFVIFPTVGFAQQKALKFGHINKQEIIVLMPERDSAFVKLQKYGQDLNDQLEAMNVELNKKIEDVSKKEKEGALSDLVKKTKYEEITQMQTRIQEFQQNASTEYNQKQAELLQPIVEKLDKAIGEIGKEGGFMYIFDISSNTIPYISADSQNITAQVKAKLGIKK